MGYTPNPGDPPAYGDLWSWSAARTNPIGFADDGRLIFGMQDGHEMWYRAVDTGTGIESVNSQTAADVTFPAYIAENDPGAGASFLFNWPLGAKLATAFVNTGFASGAAIPGYTLAAPTGGRADVRAAGIWASGKWSWGSARP